MSLGAVERNCASIVARLTDGAQLCAVVKADAYGHGAAACARAAQAGGASWLAVATADEARLLRRAGVRGRILVMGALGVDEARVAIAADADLVVWEPEFAVAGEQGNKKALSCEP